MTVPTEVSSPDTNGIAQVRVAPEQGASTVGVIVAALAVWVPETRPTWAGGDEGAAMTTSVRFMTAR
jgi:hypothetical protein